MNLRHPGQRQTLPLASLTWRNMRPGLANLADRLRAIYGPGARLALRENAPRGTVARLTLPHRPAPAA